MKRPSPPCCDTTKREGGNMNVVQVVRRRDDEVTFDDKVVRECAASRGTSHNTEPAGAKDSSQLFRR